MKQLARQAERLTKRANEIFDELFKHNPGSNGQNKMPIKDIMHLIATLTMQYVEIYTELGKKKD